MKRRFNRARAKSYSRPKVGAMNKTEQAYAEHLDERIALGEVIAWRYESITFRLADNTRYTPDFEVQLSDGTLEFHEVKACRASGAFLCEDDARVKWKVAAEMFGEFGWLMCGRLPRKSGGGWRIEQIG